MRAKAVAAVVIGLAILSVAGTAWGKGIVGGTINGPNLPSGGITIGGRGPDGEQLARLGLFEQTKDRPPTAIGVSLDQLGPRYTVEYRLAGFPGGGARVHQFLYPYSEDGYVWTYTPPGQRLGPDGPLIDAGWWVTSSSMLDVLERLGLPAPATAPTTAAPVASANPDPAVSANAAGAASSVRAESRAVWPWVAGAIGTVIVALGLLATLRIRRAPRVV
jgi:hypothetical protein